MGLFRSLVDESARPRVYRRNETICSSLRPSDRVHVIEYGYAREHTPPGEREALHDLRGAGDLVGELAFWNPAEQVKVDALTEVRAWPIDIRRLREHAAASPAVATALVQELFARNVAARRHEALARAPVAARLAVWLLHLDERYRLASDSAPPLSMETLADLVGSSPDVVQRQLNQWVRRGWLVRPGYRRLRIADPSALRDAAGSWEHLSAPWTGRVTPFLTRPGAVPGPLPVGEVPRPRQLPAAVPDFTGRQQSLDLLTAWLKRPRRTNTMVVQGLPGVGKTALATHWGYLHADRFPDGQIVIDLRGQSPSQPPMTPAEALGQILRSLGVGEHMPASDEAELMLLYRSRIAGRRLLLILDNAADPAQVRALLPGSKDCVVLVTSRTRMAPLRATGHADLMDLPVLDPGNAVALLVSVLGEDSARAADRDALAELARVCSYHPFALRISAAKLAEHPELSVQERVRELRRPERLLMSDPEEAFRSALDLAYESLGPAQRRAFRHVGLLPGRDFTPQVLAAALGVPVPEAVAAVEGLHRAYLVEPMPGPRYRVHDLVKRLARELGRHAEAGVREARARLLDHYLTVATEPGTPREWFEAERRSLVSAVRLAEESGAHGTAWRLAEAVFAPFRKLRFYANNLEVQQAGLASAMQVGNRRAIALMRGHLGSIHRDIGPSTLAARFIGEALADFDALGDGVGRARALNDLAEVHGIAGNNEDALKCAEEALELYKGIGDQAGVVSCLHTLSRLHLSQERYEPALQHAGQALDVREELGDRRGTAQSLIILARVRQHLGEPNAALSEGLEALSICHELGDEHAEAETLLCLAEIYDLLRLHHDARRDAERALAGYTATGDQYGSGRALCALGRIARNGSRYDEALAYYERALAVQVELHHEQGKAETLGDIGLVHWRLSDYLRADDYLNQALTISRVIRDEPVEARMLNRLARVRRRQGLPQVGFVYALEALDIVQGMGNRRAEADVQETLAYTYLSLGQHKPALKAAEASLAIREELRDNRASALLSIAQALYTAGRSAEALAPARETVELQNETGTRDRWAAALTTLAMVLLDLDRPEEALVHARQAREVHLECGTRRDLGCALRALGLVAARLGNRAEAADCLSEARRVLEEVGDAFEARRVTEDLRVISG
ncbi:tetratricopeptide repeat protein [Nonomuraea jiangxiensis]|uniref:cAMP-binding domain of CRP or a regulatory subunit of cAMP-dependent protein kinases n=1 Tax=Nonomuraea jiangxiensis TaxID=633440 RepID=A0A1G8LDA3_9ACTN|nr:tetratricopeptide repeat protein [Nonomuraea jiangxiensis]SDI53708.1 cAMP-binding domain of CRP or a regulatory subunit of cAMP-dependent protein kinases [Nonomuraea jiangxiensis]